jgi:hypothetical protein
MIQAVMPACQRVTLTFDPDTLGNLVYVWCAAQAIGADNLLLERINVGAPVGNVRVDSQLGLREKRISGRLAVVVSVKE